MSIDNGILEALEAIDPISLKEMDNVKLMRRTDVKFVFHVHYLSEVLKRAGAFYRVLEVNDSKLQPYETTYYDTEDDEMYRMHQNGRANRQKVRFREYINSGIKFLEVKNKNNKGETIKTRVKQGAGHFEIGDDQCDFLEKATPFDPENLSPRLNNRFIRLMLVSKVIEERITIDFNLSFLPSDKTEWTDFKSICIVEVKRNIDEKRSDFIKVLKEMRIKPMRFSKYCMGLALLDNNLKQNRFKPRVLKIKKMETQTF